MKVILEALEDSDIEQFIKDNQDAFNFGAMEEFGMRDDHFEEEGQNISMKDSDLRSLELYRAGSG